MTTIRNLFLAAIVAATTSLATAQDALKIATVDMQELFKQYFKTNEAQQQINVERARINQDNNERLVRIRELETSITTLRTQIDDPTTADSRRQSLIQNLQAQQQDVVSLDRERREFLQRRERALNEKMGQRMRGILEEIRALVVEQARKDDYDFVFDKSGNSLSQVPVLLYTKDAADITTVVLEQLNKDAPPDFKPVEIDPAAPPVETPPTEGGE
jgi:Skp family chaperone for outer membrane proteins